MVLSMMDGCRLRGICSAVLTVLMPSRYGHAVMEAGGVRIDGM